MGLRDRFSNYLYSKLENRAKDNSTGGSVHFPVKTATDKSILQSSDVYELLQDISNQLMLAEITVEDGKGNQIRDHTALKILNRPNDYLTQSEFIKLMTNTYLLKGEVFPLLNGNQIHLPTNVYTQLDNNLHEHFIVDGTELPNTNIRHIKNMGMSHLHGVGILNLGKSTLEGVMNAEKNLTDKYVKGGLLAFLLKLDAHINPQNGAQSKLINAILDQLEDIDDARSVKMIPLGKGYNIETMQSPVDDKKTLDYLNVYKKDLGKFLGINVDTYQQLIKSDFEKAMMYLHNKAVRPIMKNFEDHLSGLFFRKNSRKRIKFKINTLDFVTYSTKTNIAYNLVRTMVASPDDARDMLGFNTLNTDESSKLYVSKDLVDAKDLGNATDNSLKGGEGNGQNGDKGTNNKSD